MRHLQFAETPTRGQSYIYLEDAKSIENPRLLVGKLKKHGYARAPTPQCVSGFVCSDNFQNPFEYGHIMAWELGGPNVPENIVPMYAEWQGSESNVHESWRNMEIEIGTMADGFPNQYIFVAVVEYDNGGDNYAVQAQRFSNWDQFFDWDDYRIPTTIGVRVEPAGSAFGKRLCQEFLNPAGLGSGHVALCGELLVGYGGTPAYGKDWDHSHLPPQDRDALIRNVSAFAVEDAWEAHQTRHDMDEDSARTEFTGLGLSPSEAHQYAPAPFSPRHDEAYTFIHQHPEAVRHHLEADYHVPHFEAQNVTTGKMAYGYYHGNPAKRNVKLWVQRQDHKKKKLRELKLQASKDKRTAKFFGKLAGTH